MVRKILFIVVVAATLGAGAVVYAGRQARTLADARTEAFTRRFTATLDAAMARQDSAVQALAARFEQVDDLKTAQERQLRRYDNNAHLASARALGTRVGGQADVERLVAAGRLVRIAPTASYTIQDLELSVPYVTPDAAALLDEIGARFHAALQAHGLPLYRYEISSVLRTSGDQQDLRRENPNATSGVSTHEFGTTIDVVYHTYSYAPRPEDALPPTPYPLLNERLERLRVQAYDALGMRYWQELQGVLGRVLITLQAEGRVKVTLEREQPVFHFTVASRLPEN